MVLKFPDTSVCLIISRVAWSNVSATDSASSFKLEKDNSFKPNCQKVLKQSIGVGETRRKALEIEAEAEADGEAESCGSPTEEETLPPITMGLDNTPVKEYGI